MGQNSDDDEKEAGTHAAATFEIEPWDEKPYTGGGARLTRTRVTKTFHGDVEGQGTGRCVLPTAWISEYAPTILG